MSTFKQYLTESAKSYDFKIKIAGQIADDFASKMETALQKFEVAKMSAGKKTPIMTMPLDFPQLSNEEVTIFDVTTNYPASTREMQEYVGTYMNLPLTHIVVRKPGEPTEQYQDQMQVAKTSEYRNKLLDLEYTDLPKVKPEDFHSTKANMGLLKELLKDREDKKDQPKEKENIQSKEEKGTPSPIKGHDGPIKGNPNPAGKR
tara:strand:- start:411 stop:1019 length:609 start_codon:yes stop_codon:yes gene_type:complete